MLEQKEERLARHWYQPKNTIREFRQCWTTISNPSRKCR
jgi:hypothetical protein